MVKKKSQFGAILRKDLKLTFTWKTILLTIFVPFIMMFLIVGIPAFIVGGSETTIAVCTDDITFPVQHLNGSFIDINLGDRAIIYMNYYAADDPNIIINEVTSRSLALNTSNGIYIPANFTETTFNGGGSVEYRKSAGDFSIQGANFDFVLSLVQGAIFDAYLELKNITATEIPTVDQILYSPPVTEPDSAWSQDTMILALPFAYAMFLLLSLVGNLGRTIGFSKEKEDGTFETMLSITKNRAHLVYSKLVVGILTSIMSILAYFAGTAIAGAIAIGVAGSAGSSVEGFLALPIMDLLSYKGILILLGLGLALVVTMLVLMTVDTLFTKQVAERIGIFIILGFGMLFLITTMSNPGNASVIAQINPYYWIYHMTLSIVDLRFLWLDGIFLLLIVGLLVGLLVVARKAIEREKVLFT